MHMEYHSIHGNQGITTYLQFSYRELNTAYILVFLARINERIEYVSVEVVSNADGRNQYALAYSYD